ncbi:hypothetical protein ACFQJ5_04780 [Halomicroarcula sp. GCM10025324]|uniref:hypothetical protein n=1 Tax=Haloarcula TaxID=2237 RepID=UPI0023E8DB66|nr:hypothetical protein [Halomicroarcula sp. ZS-22-S1]
MAGRHPHLLIAVVIVVSLVATGPLVGVDATGPPATEFGDGTASVGDVAIDTTELVVTPGRFGTDVDYLRVPTAVVQVDSVSGRPRLIYVVEVPALDRSLTDQAVLTSASTTRLDPDDQAFERGQLGNESYDATLTVRVQSFTESKTVYRANVSVEVQS